VAVTKLARLAVRSVAVVTARTDGERPHGEPWTRAAGSMALPLHPCDRGHCGWSSNRDGVRLTLPLRAEAR